jgi:hypothetical protein
MRAKELKRCLTSQSQVFSGLDDSMADKLTLKPIPGCFHNRMRAKELKRRLSSQFTKKSKRVENTLHLVLSRTIQKWMEIKSI